MTALEFYSGIAGLHLALSRSDVPVSVTNAFDWDQIACDVYSANYGRGIARKPYTVLNPSAKGELDPRAKSFLHLVQNIIPELAREDAHPTHFLVENVGGFETSSTRHVLVSTLRSLGYTVAEFLLTPLQFGIPNSRLRYYLLAKRSPYSFRDLPSGDGETLRHIPGRGSTWVDSRLVEQTPDDNSVCEIREYLDPEPVDGCGIPEKILCKWGRLFDIVLPSARRTCCFTRGYTQLVQRTGSILQMNEDQDVSHNLPFSCGILTHILQTTTVFDVFLQRQLLSPTSADALDATKYRLIGNSVNVKVVQELIGYLFEEP
ncbi:S-adenosyl-L-methionine-dependent methyltransferase [Mycena olivaceomarginata]|nr:S-adenosyl-L-methionine-dependent methyltransferase [Mycena olivaceomarginata]